LFCYTPVSEVLQQYQIMVWINANNLLLFHQHFRIASMHYSAFLIAETD